MRNDKLKENQKIILKKAWKEFTIKVITSTLIRGSLLIIPIIYSLIINEISKGNFVDSYNYLLIFLGTTVIYYFFEGINQYAFYKLYNKLYDEYTKVAIKETSNNSLHSLSRFNLGEYTNIINTDIEVICNFYSNNVIRIIQMFEFIVIFGYFFSLNMNILLITIITSLTMLLFLILSGKQTEKYNIINKDNLDKKTSIIHEIFNGIKEIKYFNIFNIIDERVTNKTKEYLKSNTRYNIQFNITRFFILTVIEVVRISLMFYGIYLISKGQIELGTILIIYNYYQKIIDNFVIISTINVEYHGLKVSLNRFNKILEYSRDLETIPNAFYNYQGKIDFKDVLYGNRNEPILKNTTFNINSNTISIIISKTGKQKTSIYDLLLKMNEQHEGTITIDDIDINEIPNDIYYDLICLVEKDPAFFNLSIKDNLLLIDNDFDKVVNVCKELQIHDLILTLPDGYDTNMYDNNANITESLRQILSIARILIKNPLIMLFDETIETLEEPYQSNILKILNNLKKDHTIIIITREEEIIKYADNIIVIEGNEVVETGTHNSLMHKKGFYYDLVTLKKH